VTALAVVEDLDEVEHGRAQPLACGPGPVSVDHPGHRRGQPALAWIHRTSLRSGRPGSSEAFGGRRAPHPEGARPRPQKWPSYEGLRWSMRTLAPEVWERVDEWWGVRGRLVNGMQGVRGSNPLSSTLGQRPDSPSAVPGSPARGSRSAATTVAQADPSPTGAPYRRRWLAPSRGLTFQLRSPRGQVGFERHRDRPSPSGPVQNLAAQQGFERGRQVLFGQGSSGTVRGRL
jgi:hypothetical protein